MSSSKGLVEKSGSELEKKPEESEQCWKNSCNQIFLQKKKFRGQQIKKKETRRKLGRKESLRHITMEFVRCLKEILFLHFFCRVCPQGHNYPSKK
jgi:hypothetical protein